MNKYSFIYDYVPTTSRATAEQVADRNEVLDFMDGCPSRMLRERVAALISETIGDDVSGFVIAFIPSWSKEMTVQRFGSLARYLAECTRVETYLDALSLRQDGDPVLKTKDLVCNPQRVAGKRVILVGSIYMTGNTFSKACDMLIDGGASSVEGIFVAKIASA